MKGFLSDDPVANLENWPELAYFGNSLTRHLSGVDSIDSIVDAPNANLINAPILLSGDWGSGKTSLLLHLKNALQKKHNRGVIWLDAWRYEKECNLMTALLHCIWKSKPSGLQNNKLNAKIIFSTVLKTAASLGVRAALNSMGIKGTLANIENDFKTQGEIGPPNEPPKNQTDLLTEQFERLIDSLWPGENLKPVIIIDDLDRCSPESAVELLDQIRLLVSSHSHTGCRFVVAMDKVTLQQAIRSKFSSLSNYDSHRYLEKLFPIMLQIPRFSMANNTSLYQSLLKTCQPPLSGSDHEAWEKVFTTPYFANLRLIKRCLNTYQWIISAESTESINEVDQALLMEWLAAINRWPQLRDYLNAKSESFWRQVTNVIQNNDEQQENQESIVQELLEQPFIRDFFYESPVRGNSQYEYKLLNRIQDYKELDKFISSKGV
ncbi:KAP family P-loop NTPase fold protein [Pseudoalteromonas rubra]|uniref:KAP family P-loop NTPase fold protein n=1 Tax=Pseudoalteromonas rubra TaxID=43658 RepID=UPI000F774AE0|nr:P-loop NTPase fold protein [Pseudoalteromonas rubra]